MPRHRKVLTPTGLTLQSPTLRAHARVPAVWPFSISRFVYLPVPDEIEARLGAVLRTRRSRQPRARLSLGCLASLLWHSSKTHASHDPTGRERWEHRPVPSAGGRHPIDVLVLRGPLLGAWLYDARAHALAQVVATRSDALRDLTREAQVASARGTVLWCVAHPDRTLSRYRNGESLIWRDAGVLLGAIAVIAEALGVACTLVGPTGDRAVRRAFGADAHLAGAGGCVVGPAGPARMASIETPDTGRTDQQRTRNK